MQKHGYLTQIQFFIENYSRSKVPVKLEESSLKAEMRSQLKIAVTTRSSLVQLFPGHDIIKTSLEREIEGLFKLVTTGN